MLSNTHEGTQASGWLNQRGIAYFVVNYRLPNGDRTRPISDVEQGFRIVRDSASLWGINILWLHIQDKILWHMLIEELE